MSGSPGVFARALAAVDRLSEVTGQVFAWLVAPLILGVCYEVLARYVFNAPTVWAYDLAYMLYAGIFLLGAAYTLKRGAHIRTDFLYNNLSERARAAIDLVGYLLFLPALALLTRVTLDAALHSWAIRETTASPWWAPLYPLKWAMVVSCALLFLQGLAELIRAFNAVRRRTA